MLAASPLAEGSCGLDLNAAFGGANSSLPMTLVFPFQIMWKPYFNLVVNGATVATMQSVCPNPTLTMDTTVPNGGLVMKTANQLSLFSGWFTSGAIVKISDCNGEAARALQCCGSISHCVAPSRGASSSPRACASQRKPTCCQPYDHLQATSSAPSWRRFRTPLSTSIPSQICTPSTTQTAIRSARECQRPALHHRTGCRP